MQLAQPVFLLPALACIAWFFKTDNTKGIILAAFFFTLALV